MAPIPSTLGVENQTRKLVQTKRWITFTALLTVFAILGTHLFDRWYQQRNQGTEPAIVSGPWGDLQTWDILLEQPMEYVGFEKASGNGPSWNFGLVSPESLPGILESCGVTREQAEKLTASRVNAAAGEVILKPDEQTLLSLDPDVRSKLYLVLARNPANRFLANPYLIPDGNVTALFNGDEACAPKALSLMKGLLYRRN